MLLVFPVFSVLQVRGTNPLQKCTAPKRHETIFQIEFPYQLPDNSILLNIELDQILIMAYTLLHSPLEDR